MPDYFMPDNGNTETPEEIPQAELDSMVQAAGDLPVVEAEDDGDIEPGGVGEIDFEEHEEPLPGGADEAAAEQAAPAPKDEEPKDEEPKADAQDASPETPTSRGDRRGRGQRLLNERNEARAEAAQLRERLAKAEGKDADPDARAKADAEAKKAAEQDLADAGAQAIEIMTDTYDQDGRSSFKDWDKVVHGGKPGDTAHVADNIDPSTMMILSMEDYGIERPERVLYNLMRSKDMRESVAQMPIGKRISYLSKVDERLSSTARKTTGDVKKPRQPIGDVKPSGSVTKSTEAEIIRKAIKSADAFTANGGWAN